MAAEICFVWPFKFRNAGVAHCLPLDSGGYIYSVLPLGSYILSFLFILRWVISDCYRHGSLQGGDPLTSPIAVPQHPREYLAGRRLRFPPRSKAPALPMRVADLQSPFPSFYPWWQYSRRTSLLPSRREEKRTRIYGSWTLFDGMGTTLTFLDNTSSNGWR